MTRSRHGNQSSFYRLNVTKDVAETMTMAVAGTMTVTMTVVVAVVVTCPTLLIPFTCLLYPASCKPWICGRVMPVSQGMPT